MQPVKNNSGLKPLAGPIVEPTLWNRIGGVALTAIDFGGWLAVNAVVPETLQKLIPKSSESPSEGPGIFKTYLPTLVNALYVNFDPTEINQENTHALHQLGDFTSMLEKVEKSLTQTLPDIAEPHRPLIEQIAHTLVLQASVNLLESGLAQVFKNGEQDYPKIKLELLKHFFPENLTAEQDEEIEQAFILALKNGGGAPAKTAHEFVLALNKNTLSSDKVIVASLARLSLVTGDFLNGPNEKLSEKLDQVLALFFPEGIDNALYSVVPSWTATALVPIVKSLIVDRLKVEMEKQSIGLKDMKKGYEALPKEERESVKASIPILENLAFNSIAADGLLGNILNRLRAKDFPEQDLFFKMLEKNGKHFLGHLLFKLKDRFKDKDLSNELATLAKLFEKAIKEKDYQTLSQELVQFAFPEGLEKELQAIIPLPFISQFAPDLCKKQLASLLEKIVGTFVEDFKEFKEAADSLPLTSEQKHFCNATTTFVERFIPSYLASSPKEIADKIDKQIVDLNIKILNEHRQTLKTFLPPVFVAIGQNPEMKIAWDAMGLYLKSILKKGVAGLDKTLNEKNNEFIYDIVHRVLDRLNNFERNPIQDKKKYYKDLVAPLLKAVKMETLPFPKEFEGFLMDFVKETVIPSGIIDTLLELTFKESTKTTLFKKIAEKMAIENKETLTDPLKNDYKALANALQIYAPDAEQKQIIDWLKVVLKPNYPHVIQEATDKIRPVFSQVDTLSKRIIDMIKEKDPTKWKRFNKTLFPLISKILKEERILNQKMEQFISKINEYLPPSFTRWYLDNKTQVSTEAIASELRAYLNKPMTALLNEYLYKNVAETLDEQVNTLRMSEEDRIKQEKEEEAQSAKDKKELPRMYQEGVRFQYRKGIKKALINFLIKISNALKKILPSPLYKVAKILIDLTYLILERILDHVIFPLVEILYLNRKVKQFYKQGSKEVYSTKFDDLVHHVIDVLKESFPA